MGACRNGKAESVVACGVEEDEMRRHEFGMKQAFPASEAERAAIRALKNWLLSMPGEAPFEDPIVRLRIASAIATMSEGLNKPDRLP